MTQASTRQKNQGAPNGGSATLVAHITNHPQEELRYSDDELEEFREIIVQKKKDAKKIIVFNEEIIAGIEDHKTEAVSFAKTDDDYDLEALAKAKLEIKRQNDFLEKLEWALVRIENKTYGICHKRRTLIDKARLRSVPHATLSVEAKLSRNFN